MKRSALKRRSTPLRRTRLKAKPKPTLPPAEKAERTAFCHNNHHSANGPKVRREWLSETHLNFASEVLGASAGTYLARRYR